MAEEPKPESTAKPAAAAPAKPAGPTVVPWESDLTAELKEAFGDKISEFSSYVGQEYLVAEAGSVIAILDYLKLDCEFDYLVDLTAVDWPDKPEGRFELVYILYSFARNQRIRVKTRVAEGTRPETAVGVHLTANWLEREVYDMFGIEFEGHPDMKRLLLPEEWQGYPLRKDYGIIQMDNRWVRENMGIESGQ